MADVWSKLGLRKKADRGELELQHAGSPTQPVRGPTITPITKTTHTMSNPPPAQVKPLPPTVIRGSRPKPQAPDVTKNLRNEKPLMDAAARGLPKKATAWSPGQPLPSGANSVAVIGYTRGEMGWS
jgi:hypothetical protein